MNIVTFGSCLSRYTGNNFAYLYGGKILSSVYHNRSDVFVNRFLDGTEPELKREDIWGKLNPTSDDKNNLSFQLINNQIRETQGSHLLAHGIPFMDVFSKKVDLVIFDNYMDISARLLTVEGTPPDSRWFIRPKDLLSNVDYKMGELLSPEEGSKAMLKIINYIHEKSPQAHLVFINFPHNTYALDESRVMRTQEYECLMQTHKVESLTVMPCMNIPEKFQTHERQHFKPALYCSLAGVIWGRMNLN